MHTYQGLNQYSPFYLTAAQVFLSLVNKDGALEPFFANFSFQVFLGFASVAT